jgi:hypothetical protein
MNERLALSTVYKQFPNVARNIRGTSQYIAKESEDVFYDVECNKRVKLGEILKFTATHPNRYTWIKRSDYEDTIFYQSYNFMYTRTVPKWKGNIFIGYDYLYHLLYMQSIIELRNIAASISVNSIVVPKLIPDLPLIMDQDFGISEQFEDLAISEQFEDIDKWIDIDSLIDLINPNSYEIDSSHYITLDVKSLYEVILNRDRCTDHFGKIFAKLYVLREFTNFIDKFRQYKHGAIMINFYVADNANMLDIKYDKMLLMTAPLETESFKFIDEFWQQHIINTVSERERVIQVIKDAIQNF